ncbi:SGNH/GDSL hydrolase family protein [Streptacidiphilus jiangxiensis]|uniref:Lysophospholipase L1 n=1 Tax=Streptacidiphilus jiangxiensis TaxID=235985 RepID=A0A1H7Z3A3_STRJI|nr:SGNH/GDSL hydrolase family protein [Streptacidiphilus jiangxiensis]SEM52796.1 Lysophospholipase L1 [Streptacidiphilus jiangxiensis]
MSATSPRFRRYVAVGDSQTEGLGDGDEATGWRGWADRLAETIAQQEPDLLYANLAVRGRLAGQVRAEQLAPALALQPDLVSVVAGMNDLMRPGVDTAAVTADLEAMFVAFTATGARVLTFTFPDIGRIAPPARALRPRVLDLNARIRAAAERHGVVVVDFFPRAATTDPRMWSADRLHASPLGHARIAAAAAEALPLPGSDSGWAEPLPPLAPVGLPRRAVQEAAWIGSFLGPWLLRRVRGRSSGDGRTAKRPDLRPVTAPQPVR